MVSTPFRSDLFEKVTPVYEGDTSADFEWMQVHRCDRPTKMKYREDLMYCKNIMIVEYKKGKQERNCVCPLCVFAELKRFWRCCRWKCWTWGCRNCSLFGWCAVFKWLLHLCCDCLFGRDLWCRQGGSAGSRGGCCYHLWS